MRVVVVLRVVNGISNHSARRHFTKGTLTAYTRRRNSAAAASAVSSPAASRANPLSPSVSPPDGVPVGQKAPWSATLGPSFLLPSRSRGDAALGSPLHKRTLLLLLFFIVRDVYRSVVPLSGCRTTSLIRQQLVAIDLVSMHSVSSELTADRRWFLRGRSGRPGSSCCTGLVARGCTMTAARTLRKSADPRIRLASPRYANYLGMQSARLSAWSD